MSKVSNTKYDRWGGKIIIWSIFIIYRDHSASNKASSCSTEKRKTKGRRKMAVTTVLADRRMRNGVNKISVFPSLFTFRGEALD